MAIRTKEEAREWRTQLDTAAATVDDAVAIDTADIFPAWHIGTLYVKDYRVRWVDKLWKCLQPHTSQDGWEPSNTPALWVEVAAPGQYRQIKESMLSTEAFALGEIGWWQTEGNLYRSTIAANVYTPVTYPAGWERI